MFPLLQLQYLTGLETREMLTAFCMACMQEVSINASFAQIVKLHQLIKHYCSDDFHVFYMHFFQLKSEDSCYMPILLISVTFITESFRQLFVSLITHASYLFVLFCNVCNTFKVYLSNINIQSSLISVEKLYEYVVLNTFPTLTLIFSTSVKLKFGLVFEIISLSL